MRLSLVAEEKRTDIRRKSERAERRRSGVAEEC